MYSSFRVHGVVWLALLSLLIVFSGCARKQAVSEKPSLLPEAAPPAMARPAPTPGPAPGAAVPPGVGRPMRPEMVPGMRPGEEARPGVREEAVRPRPREEAVAVRPGVAAALAAVPLKDIYFDFDKYNIRPEARKTLEENARWLLENPKVKVQIEGHADERGTDEYNLALGERRAEAARSYLKSLGVKVESMSTISYGEFRPVDPGHNEEAWTKNRRDHFGVTAP